MAPHPGPELTRMEKVVTGRRGHHTRRLATLPAVQPRIDDPKVGRARPSRNLVRVGALVAAIVVGALWFTREPTPELSGSTGSTPTAGQPSTGAAEDPVVVTRRGVNKAGGYTFRYPRGWRVRKDDETTELKAPGSRTIVSLAAGNATSARRVAKDLYALIDAIPTYTKLRRLDADREAFAGGDAYLISGTAVNEAGVRVRLLAVGVDRGRRTFPVTIFTAADTDPGRVLPRVEAIVASVEPLRSG